jgi:hypothetical protein
MAVRPVDFSSGAIGDDKALSLAGAPQVGLDRQDESIVIERLLRASCL